MSERTWNEEEIRAAVMEKARGTYVEPAVKMYGGRDADMLMSTLTKPTPPPIHPDVPVMYDFNGEPCTAFAHYDFHSGVTNIRPLISTEAAQSIVKDLVDSFVPGYEEDEAIEYSVKRIAHYIKTGEV